MYDIQQVQPTNQKMQMNIKTLKYNILVRTELCSPDQDITSPEESSKEASDSKADIFSPMPGSDWIKE